MNKNEAPGTAKKGLFRVVFSRTGIIQIGRASCRERV